MKNDSFFPRDMRNLNAEAHAQSCASNVPIPQTGAVVPVKWQGIDYVGTAIIQNEAQRERLWTELVNVERNKTETQPYTMEYALVFWRVCRKYYAEVRGRQILGFVA